MHCVYVQKLITMHAWYMYPKFSHPSVDKFIFKNKYQKWPLLKWQASVTEIFCTDKRKSNNLGFTQRFSLCLLCVEISFALIGRILEREIHLIKQDQWSNIIFFSVCIDMIRHDFVAPNPIVIFSWSIWSSHKPIVAPGEEMYKQLIKNYSPVGKDNVCWSFCSNDVALYWIRGQMRNLLTLRQHCVGGGWVLTILSLWWHMWSQYPVFKQLKLSKFPLKTDFYLKILVNMIC